MAEKWTTAEIERYLGQRMRFNARVCPFCGQFNLTPLFEQMPFTASIYAGRDENGKQTAKEYEHYCLTSIQLECNYCHARGAKIERDEQEIKHINAGGNPYTSDEELISRCASSWRVRRG